MRCPFLTACLALLAIAAFVDAQTISNVQPRTCLPGQTTRLTVLGTDLNESLCAVASSSATDVRIASVNATQAIVEVTLPQDAPLGPFGIWFASSSGPLRQQVLMTDDLPPVADSGNNHSQATAQVVPSLCVIEGQCDASESDFYRFTVTAGQRVAFEVHSQALRSAFDPVVRLLDENGTTLHLSDDSGVGPDCRFSHPFPTAGDYGLEIHDSRNSAGGAAYHLRIGDFPIVTNCYPLAVQRGRKATLRFAGLDGELASTCDVEVTHEVVHSTNVTARLPGGKSSAWVPVIVSQHAQVQESKSLGPLTVPVGVSGQIGAANEIDTFPIQGVKGQLVRFDSRTRSAGCSTLLQMQLFNAAGIKVAETKVNEADEWSFDFTFPDDGVYQLQVTDLLKRGGSEFGYWFSISAAGSFNVALKADAATREMFTIETETGACEIDLQIERFGYDGELELSLAEAPDGLRILNPLIAASATAAKVYLVADGSWKPNNINLVHLVATAKDSPQRNCIVSSRALHRVKEPFVLSPSDWSNGAIMLSAASHTDDFFAFEPQGVIQFARPLNSHTATLSLKRLQSEFKAAVTVLGSDLPEGWGVDSKADGDTYTLTLPQSEQAVREPSELPLLVYGEFNGHGRIESYSLPVEWIDPIQVSLEYPAPIFPGTRASVRAKLVRRGKNPLPVTLTFDQLPPGVTGPETPINVPADQSFVDFDLQIADDLSPEEQHTLSLTAASQFAGQEFSIATLPTHLPLTHSPRELVVYPGQISLDDSRSRQRLVITGIDSQQMTRDWTRHARMTSADSSIAEVRNGVVYPKSNGETDVVVEVGSRRQSIPVRVGKMDVRRPVEFESEVLVALSKQGCNSGACHGSPSGKGGFRLSLRAFDRQLDELTLIREDFGRRVNSLEPEQSLLLQKPLMKVAHGGGKQLHNHDEAYHILLDWIAGGATSDPTGTRRATKLEVYPNQKQVLAVADGGQQLAVTAHFSDGSRADVTHLVAYETSDTSVATVDANGFVTPHHRGEVAILVRYLEYIESVPLMFVSNQEGFAWRSPPPNNYVDELVNAKLQQLQYLPSETCTDSEFLRRASLDVIGILPTVSETEAFLADSRVDKRTQLIDSLLERDEYAKFWALKWGDLLRMTSKLVGDEGVYKYHRWLEESLNNNMPYDEFAKQLLTGTGSTLSNPPANFYRTATDMNECVETISQVFLGARLQCAKCHNHPFERWTQDNYYGLGAFFNRVQRRKTERPGELFVYTSFSGDVTQPRTGQIMAPWLPHVGSIEAKDDADRRAAFAEWLIDPNNRYFARIEANRIWSHLFSRGIVDPIDDFRDSNPPSNDRLLDALAKDFVDSGYDRKHLLRVILRSRTYQASFKTNEFNKEDVKYFSHQEPRLLSAEQLLDAINQTLSLSQKFGDLPAGTRATQLPAPDVVKVDFLKVFGQPERSTVCACERADDSNLGMAIELFNGPMMHEKLRDAKNRFRVSLEAGRTVEEAVRELYLAAICRPPSQNELNAALQHCAKGDEPAARLEDVCWALFNTDEFLFQH